MVQRLTNSLIFYHTGFYPYISSIKSSKANTVVLGIGGNIGDVKQRFQKLFLMLLKNNKFTILKTSPILQNPPFGYLQQEDFFNTIIILKTNLAPIPLLNILQRYELRFGRTRSFKDAPRTLDIDIIFYNNLKFQHSRLNIPHLHYKNRDSVLLPLKWLSINYPLKR